MERDKLGKFIKGHKGYQTFKENPKYHRHDGLVWHSKIIKHGGSHRTKRYKKKISQTVSKLWENKEYRNKHLGNKNPNWKGGAMNHYKTISYRMRAEIRIWASSIKKRDGKCVLCGSGKNLQADHIKPVALYPKLALNLNNGRALCFTCHIRTQTYGKKANK